MAPSISDTLTEVNSDTRICIFSVSLRNRGVSTIDQIYRDNLRLLVKEAKTQDALAELIGKSPAQISQWINASKDSKTGKPRAMSRGVARSVEKAMGKPEGWMDVPHPDAGKPIKGAFLDELTDEHLALLADFNVLLDDDKHALMEQAALMAAKTKKLRAEILARYSPKAEKEAHASNQAITRAAVQIGDQLKQRSLLDDKDG
ncbi:MAG: hypothetical protein JWR07_1948 [Nevskia sp.]|nr:hypothetical protein [Nevskia sp.]